jgi:tight adherence protein B
MDTLLAYRMIASAAAFLGAAALVLLLQDPAAAWHRRRRRVLTARLQALFIRDAPVEMGLWLIYVLAVITLLGVALALESLAAGLCVAGLLLVVPDAVVAFLYRRRRSELDRQVPDAIQSMANSLKAGASLVQALGEVATGGPEPIREEFRLILEEYHLGAPLDRALDNARRRIANRNLDLAFAVLLVGRETGGNMPRLLERTAGAVRELWRLEEEVRTKTAEGRFSAKILGVMPVVLLGLYALIDPGAIGSLFAHPAGIATVAVAAVLTIAGMIWTWRIARMDV